MILLVVDAQEMLMNDKLYNFNLFKENVEKLITHARKCGKMWI
jgi:nicotinamidase-related amidase